VRSLQGSGPLAPGTPTGRSLRAILGTLNWALPWYNPGGERSAKEMADVLSSCLVRGLQARPESRMLASGRPSMQRVFNGPADA